MSRTPLDISPTIEIADWVTCLDDVIDNDRHARDYFKVTGYDHQGKIVFPFSEQGENKMIKMIGVWETSKSQM